MANNKRVYGGADGKIILFRPAEAHQKVLDALMDKSPHKTKSEIMRSALLEFGRKCGVIENTLKASKKIVPCLFLFLLAGVSYPYITLSSPEDNLWNTSDSITFQFTAYDDGPTSGAISHCELWGDFSGTWENNIANYTVVNNTQGTFSSSDIPGGLDEGIFRWNVMCYDNASHNASASSTYRFNHDMTPPPAIIPDSVLNQSGATWINISWTAQYDMSGIAKYLIWRNETNVANTTDLSYNDTGLSEYTLYGYIVEAMDNAGWFGDNHSTMTFLTNETTPPSQVTGPPAPPVVSGSVICVPSWICTDWSECGNGIQTRICKDANNCGITSNKPPESQNCSLPSRPAENQSNQTANQTQASPRISEEITQATGAAAPVTGNGTTITGLVFAAFSNPLAAAAAVFGIAVLSLAAAKKFSGKKSRKRTKKLI